MAALYGDYTRDRVGMFFGLTGVQLSILVVAAMPVLWAVNERLWASAGIAVLVWLVVFVLAVVPVRGRSATGWLLGLVSFTAGTVLRVSRWRSKPALGVAEDLGEPDLPGVAAGVRVHDGPPQGPFNTRLAIIQDKATGVWAATAAISHAGLALADSSERDSQGRGLTVLLNACARTELISELILQVRSVPDDGAERAEWMASHTDVAAPELSLRVNRDMAGMLSRASVRTEAFVTIVVPEHRLARRAKEFGRGVDGRARAMHMLMAEVESHLRTQMAVREVTWLTSPQLATAVRTGFAPGDRAGIVAALARRANGEQINADVPWAQAGPAGAEQAVRHYAHDSWHSISAAVKLPARGAVLGALAPVLTPGQPGERRSLVTVFPILQATAADRKARNAEWGADMSQTLRDRAGVKTRAKDRESQARTRGLDSKLAAGHALVRLYAVACVTVPATMNITEFGSHMDVAIRRAGFAPLRLDMSQDAGFAAANLPLGICLHRKGAGA